MENEILGTDGDDIIDTTSGNDNVSAGAGFDTIYASEGNDTIDGGDGEDHIVYEADSSQATVTSDGDVITVQTESGTDTLVSVETVFFQYDESYGDLADFVQAPDPVDPIDPVEPVEFIQGLIERGTRSDDLFIGSDLSDAVRGRKGDDIFETTGAGFDEFRGGRGEDTVVYTDLLVEDVEFVTMGRGFVRVLKDDGSFDTIKSIETVEFADGQAFSVKDLVDQARTEVRGTKADDLFVGTDGNDKFRGRKGDDIFQTDGQGHDVFQGGKGYDVVEYAVDMIVGVESFGDNKYRVLKTDGSVDILKNIEAVRIGDDPLQDIEDAFAPLLGEFDMLAFG